MKIRFWGTRGSIASPGPETIKYGGNTSCLEVRLANGKLIILDAGTGIRKLGIKLFQEPGPVKATFLITHAHWDHIEGFPYFQPAYVEGSKFSVIGCHRASKKIESIFYNMMEGVYFPVLFEELKAEFDFKDFCKGEFDVGDAHITVLPTNHPGDTQAYKIRENNISIVYMTDNDPYSPIFQKISFSRMAEFCADVDLLVHDTMFTKEEWEMFRTWGHSSVDAALDLATKAGVKRFALFHHDPEHSDQKVDQMVRYSREFIKEKNCDIRCFGAQEGMEFELP
ncbi:MAG: hypothetical protein A2161_05715 [Candidatus Schekmanbacteria bacterium RBG_13_48_7]|uniref:Metallo-beta-lactamase domain-containing protein n=1 Tax=Candidatus Schekmanbacteria bacterium RBG_13_48_7 TaxID=1817878 RepID=A0A1F7RPZ8_9BACT|nr:MAG: hypothetical protein A2161_05715 [Candidatus Schekmanbacteria bacterium RBG_13_48_7]